MMIVYPDIRYLHRPSWAGETAAAAMNFLANTHALIIDLHKCTAGTPGMIALLRSYLFGEEPVRLDSIYWRDDVVARQYWTLPFVPGKRFVEEPVYLLMSKGTFSAGEGLAYILQAAGGPSCWERKRMAAPTRALRTGLRARVVMRRCPRLNNIPEPAPPFLKPPVLLAVSPI
jgi:hypothetical protein